MKKFFEAVKVAAVMDEADIKGAGATTGYQSIALYRRIAAFLKTGTVAEGKKATLTLMQATSDAGANAKVLKSIESALAGASGNAFTLQIEADVGEFDLANGFKYVAMKAVTDDTVAVTGAGALLLTEARYEPV